MADLGLNPEADSPAPRAGSACRGAGGQEGRDHSSAQSRFGGIS